MSFKIATKFRDAAVVINGIPVEKFPLLLNRVIQKLHIRNTRLFSEEEESQLKALFSLSDEDLKLVLDGCCYIFEQVLNPLHIICFPEIFIVHANLKMKGSVFKYGTRTTIRNFT